MVLLPKLPQILPRRPDSAQHFERSLIRHEARLGGQLFGPLPKGRQRQFFCLDEHTWIWYEEWSTKQGRRSVTTRYEVRPNGILKVQGDQPYQRLTRQEADNFYRAVRLYGQRVSALYRQLLQAA
jgi:hypothetical protein